MKKLTKEQIKKYINGEVYYDPDGTYLWIRGAEDELQMLGEIRGWGRIQNMFKNPDGTINQQAAADFQDGIGHFVANAVNTALESLGEEEVESCEHDWTTSGLYSRFCRKCKATQKINRTKNPE